MIIKQGFNPCFTIRKEVKRMNDLYAYMELVDDYKHNPSQFNYNRLLNWFRYYGNAYWNGEYYYCSELDLKLYDKEGD